MTQKLGISYIDPFRPLRTPPTDCNVGFAKLVLVLDRSSDYDAFLGLMNMYFRHVAARVSLADRNEQVPYSF